MVCGPLASACASQRSPHSKAGHAHDRHVKHSSDMCSGEHNEQATFEVASFFTLRLRIAQGKMHTGSRAVLSVHDLSPTSLYKNKEGGKSSTGRESATGCLVSCADQGGREPPVERSQHGTKPCLTLPEAHVCIAFLASGKQLRGREPAEAVCRDSNPNLQPLCPGKDEGGHPGVGVNGKLSPSGKHRLDVGRVGAHRAGTNHDHSAEIGFSNPKSLVSTLAGRASREGNEGTDLTCDAVHGEASQCGGVHYCTGRRRRRPRRAPAAAPARLARLCSSPGDSALDPAGWFLEFRRVGEAAHPGPEPGSQLFQDWRSANITGFCHAEAALAWNADVLGITELRGSPVEAAKIGKKLGKPYRARCPRLTARA